MALPLLGQSHEEPKIETEPPILESRGGTSSPPWRLATLEPKPSFPWEKVSPFLGGVVAGLAIHETGHMGAGAILGKDPYFTRTNSGVTPFFTVAYGKAPTNDRQAFTLAAAGFWMQHAMAEAILAKYPKVWRDAPPAVQGAFVFHLLTSLIYTYGALAKSGAPERDTLGMARSLNVDERWMGVAILLPAALDLYRSFHPEARWATWSSRGVKVGFVFGITR